MAKVFPELHLSSASWALASSSIILEVSRNTFGFSQIVADAIEKKNDSASPRFSA
jgi:hypothetical protein